MHFTIPECSATLSSEDNRKESIDHDGSPQIGLEFDRLGEWERGPEKPGTSGLGNCTPGTKTPGEDDLCITIGQVTHATGYAV